MRANCYPTTEDVKRVLSEGGARFTSEGLEGILERIPDYLTLLLGVKVRFEVIEETRELEPGKNYLDTWPIGVFSLEGSHTGRFFIDKALGLVLSKMPLTEFNLVYEVGFKQGYLPALFRETILELAAYLVDKTEDRKETVVSLLEVLKSKVRSDEQERIKYG